MNELPQPIPIVIWGAEGSWKTTMALSFPRPIVHFDIDVGGYERAAWNLADTKDIETKSYAVPIPIDKLKGRQKIQNGKEVSIRLPKRVLGYMELWQEIVQDFVEALQRKEVKTIVIDSATKLWEICHTSYLQELQESQIVKDKLELPRDENKLRERLQQVEYGEPNRRMDTLAYSNRSYKKNLVFTHYSRPKYIKQLNAKTGEIESVDSGRIEIDGYKGTRKVVDAVIELVLDNKGMVTAQFPSNPEVFKCAIPGLGSTVIGQVLPEPSYQGLVDLREALVGTVEEPVDPDIGG